MQDFFSKLFNKHDDYPIGLVSLGIKKTGCLSRKNSVNYDINSLITKKNIYKDKKVLTLNDFMD